MVDSPGRRTDHAHFRDVEEAAKVCLRESPYRMLTTVLCECDHGVLFLKGRLSSFYHKQVAQEAVARVKGVSRVVNEIEVGNRTDSDASPPPISVIGQKTQFRTDVGRTTPQAKGSIHPGSDPEAAGKHPHQPQRCGDGAQ